MRTSLKVIDDFYPLPEELRECALSIPDKDEVFDGHTYRGWRRYEHAGFEGMMRERLANIMGWDVEIKLHSFVVATRKFETTQWIHADTIGAQYACVLHLHHGNGGTAFWRHIQTGEETQGPALVEKLGGAEATVKRISEDGQTKDAWEMTSLAGAKFNRIYIYPSNLFHSRWPKQAFGETQDDARITWVAFFNAGGFQ